MIKIIKLIQLMGMIMLALPAYAFGKILDVIIDAIVKYQIKNEKCEDCDRE